MYQRKLKSRKFILMKQFHLVTFDFPIDIHSESLNAELSLFWSNMNRYDFIGIIYV